MLIELLTKKYPGMRQWLTQRLSAVIMALYTLLFIALVFVQQPVGFEAWRAFFLPWWWRAVTWLFFVCLVMHAWLGVRDVLKDYVPNLEVRAYFQLLVEMLLVLDMAWATYLLWTIK